MYIKSLLLFILLAVVGCGNKTGDSSSQKKEGHSEHDGHDHGDDHSDQKKEDHSDHEGHDHGDDHSDQEKEGHSEHDGHDHSENTSEKRVPIPDAVKRNLGLVFAKAKYRSVAATITLPGHFELNPSAEQHYPLPETGRVTIMVQPLQEVQKGDTVAKIDAPAWRQLQQQLTQASSDLTQAKAEVIRAQASQHAAGKIGGVDNELNVYAADLQVANGRADAARANQNQLILQASTLTGISPGRLKKVARGSALWARLQHIPIRAASDGVVQEIEATSGTWVEQGTEIVHIVSPNKLRFKAVALQSDIYDDLKNGQIVTIVPPTAPGDLRVKQSVQGVLRLGVTGNPEIRTVDIFIDLDEEQLPSWVRPEMSAVAKVVTSGSTEDEELSVPSRAIIQDGLDTVYFRVDPDNENFVIRTIADLGPSDGKWTTIYSGLAEDDKVVVDGVYQLKLATSAQATKGGHFEADGTWHEGGEH